MYVNIVVPIYPQGYRVIASESSSVDSDSSPLSAWCCRYVHYCSTIVHIELWFIPDSVSVTDDVILWFSHSLYNRQSCAHKLTVLDFWIYLL